MLFLVGSGRLLVEAQLAAYTGTDTLHKAASDWAASTGQLETWAAALAPDRVEVIAAHGHA